ncbi:MAG: exo-beta-N-acetylmuramidase NamZ domain-containing protein [Myxococcota bacterium]
MLFACSGAPTREAPAPEPAPPTREVPPPGEGANLDVDDGEAPDQSAESGAGAEAIRISVTTERAIDAAVQAALSAGQVPGAVVLVGDGSGVAFERAYGMGALEPEVAPMRANAIFDLASLTKVFTAALAMRLEEAGRLELDAPIESFAALRGRSVRDLLLHRTGLPAVDRLAQYRPERAANIARIASLTPEPAGTYRYSDLGYVLLGEVLGASADASLPEALARWVLEPARSGARFGPVPEALPTEYAPRRGPDAPMIRGVVHDPRAYRLGGMAGHAGLFGTARDVAALLRALGDPAFFSAEGHAELTEVTAIPRAAGSGQVRRTLAFAVDDEHLEHRGFTGTYLRYDPARRTYLVVMTHQVHPRGQGDAAPLRASLAEVFDDAEWVDAPRAELRLGIDRLVETDFAALQNKAIGLLTHDAAVARNGARTRALFREHLQLAALFSPEHGFGSNREGAIADGTLDGVPAYSLFGRRRDPSPEVMATLDVVVVDLQDVGARFYTYFATMHRMLRAAAAADVKVIVLDRPNPLGRRVRGPISVNRSFINHHPLPIQHGMSAGEMAALMVAEDGLELELEVVAMEGYAGEPWAATGLRWIPPSPNLPDLEAVRLYPGVALVEGANVSVGRGTDRPFRLVGAPYVNAEAFAEAVGGEAVSFRPRTSRFRGRRCTGVQLSGPQGVDAVALGFRILRHLSSYEAFDRPRVSGMLADDALLERALALGPLDFSDDEARFAARRAPHLLYTAP